MNPQTKRSEYAHILQRRSWSFKTKKYGGREMAQAILMGVVSKGHPAGLMLWEGRDRAYHNRSNKYSSEFYPRSILYNVSIYLGFACSGRLFRLRSLGRSNGLRDRIQRLATRCTRRPRMPQVSALDALDLGQPVSRPAQARGVHTSGRLRPRTRATLLEA